MTLKFIDHISETTYSDDTMEDYQALTEREEADLVAMMKDCQYSITHANIFTEKLTKDLSALDGVSMIPVFWTILIAVVVTKHDFHAP